MFKLKQYLFQVLALCLLATGIGACATARRQTAANTPLQLQDAPETALSDEQRNEMEFLFIQGINLKRAHNLQEAAAVFSRCLEIDPNSAAAMYELAGIHLLNNDMTSASLMLEAIQKVNKTNKYYKEMLAQVYQERKEYAKAAAIYDELAKMFPENDEYTFRKAGMLAVSGNCEESLAIYNELEQKVGMNIQITSAKQAIFLELKKPDEALREINRFIDSSPNSIEGYSLLADFYQSQGKKAEVLETYNKILQIEPDNGAILFAIADYYLEDGKFDVAYNYVLQAFNNDEVDQDAKVQFYVLLMQNKQKSMWTDRQINELLNILQAKYPKNSALYPLFADRLLREEKLPEAYAYLKQYLNESPEDEQIWEHLLYIANDLQDTVNLYSDSKKALEYFPKNPVFCLLNAVGAMQRDNYTEALNVLERGAPYARNEKMRLSFNIYKAEACYKLNRHKDAFALFEEVIKKDPENYMSMNNYAYYLSLRNEELDKAERLSSQTVKSDPTNDTFLDTYAWVLFKQKEYEKAKTYIELSLENGGSANAVIVEHYGDILYMLGQRKKAVEQWKKAKELGEGSDKLDQKIKESKYIESQKP
ncbi:MAG: tetratricopeptide repeat protein [Bacteroidales bacterium]|jgi:tetratricopeptide (TPR) repeat protein|nr:tetratricopeptide repeat protein [Bacteroidales bacterium]